MTIRTKLYIVYTNPPCNDRLPYHTFNEKYTSHIDTQKKVCYKCKSKADVVVNKKYYCATHAINLIE